MEFTSQRIYTGKETRVSKKTNEEYTLVNFLDENGQSFGVIAKCFIPKDIKQLQQVKAKFNVKTGRYLQLELVGLEVV